MFQLPLVEKIIGYGWKAGTYLKNRQTAQNAARVADETNQKEQQVLIALRNATYSNNGNCLKPPVGSPEDAFCSNMVAKGQLIRSPFGGYMLAEMGQQLRSAYQPAY
jgi:hypothetical protein